MTTFRSYWREQFGAERFRNAHEGGKRISLVPFSGSPDKTNLSYDEFVDSFFGPKRADIEISDFEVGPGGWRGENEVEHWGEVLAENVDFGIEYLGTDPKDEATHFYTANGKRLPIVDRGNSVSMRDAPPYEDGVSELMIDSVIDFHIASRSK